MGWQLVSWQPLVGYLMYTIGALCFNLNTFMSFVSVGSAETQRVAVALIILKSSPSVEMASSISQNSYDPK